VRTRPTLLAAALFAALAGVCTYPQIVRIHDGLPRDAQGEPFEDPFLNAWILAWGARAAVTDPGHLFDTNAFWPRTNTLAYSDHMLGYLPLTVPIYWLTKNAILLHNCILLLSFFASGFGAFLLARSITGAAGPSLLAGVVFAFCPFRFENYGQVQILSTQWMPLALCCLHRCDRKIGEGGAFPWKAYTGLITFGALQSLTSTYYSLFFPVFVCCFALFAFPFSTRGNRLKRVLSTLSAPIIWTVLVLPTILPYLHLRREIGLVRELDEVIRYSATLDSFLAAPECNRAYGSFLARLPAHSAAAFPGLITCLLTGGAVLWLLRGRTWRDGRESGRLGWVYLLCGGTTALLAMGPRIRIAGEDLCWGPYVLLYRSVPGFDGVRAPGRFLMLTMLCLAVLTALGAERLTRRIECKRKKHILLGGLGLGLLAEFACIPQPLVRVPVWDQIPPVYQWLSQQKGKKRIAETPLDLGLEDKRRMYYSTHHWHIIVNGKSGLLLPESAAMFMSYARPGAALVSVMAELEIDYVVVHDSLMPGLRSHYERIPELHLERSFGPTSVFRLSRQGVPPPKPNPSRAGLVELPRDRWRVATNSAVAHVHLARDGDPLTAWVTDTDQQQGMLLRITLGKPRRVRRVRLHFGTHGEQIPRLMQVLVTSDNATWREVLGPRDWPDTFARVYRSALRQPRDPVLDIEIPDGLWADIELRLLRGYPARWAIAEIEVLETPDHEGVP